MIDFDAAMCYDVDARNERGLWQGRNTTTAARFWGWVLVNAVVVYGSATTETQPQARALYLEEALCDSGG
jgi:hypothetical protein